MFNYKYLWDLETRSRRIWQFKGGGANFWRILPKNICWVVSWFIIDGTINMYFYSFILLKLTNENRTFYLSKHWAIQIIFNNRYMTSYWYSRNSTGFRWNFVVIRDFYILNINTNYWLLFYGLNICILHTCIYLIRYISQELSV